VKDYTHSTAPNRRFADLVTQRLAKAALAGRPSSYGAGELAQIAARCTAQSDAAAKVERRVLKSATAQFVRPRIGQTFDALVTGAADKGTWVRVFAPPMEGKLVRGQAGLDVGERVRVTLTAVDVARGFIDFVRA
jgi:exoribonuclease-2